MIVTVTALPGLDTAPSGPVPAAENFFEATTVYFGKRPAVSHVCSSRAGRGHQLGPVSTSG